MRKPSALLSLLSAQFLSAFVDNMILFVVLVIIRNDGYGDYYLPFVQSTFLAAYVIWSPWVGRFADKHAKANVLIIGNALKAGGVILLMLKLDPAFSYAVVGLGAAVYSPAKYGILPFLTKDEEQLMKANSWMEGTTIAAILSGAVVGGFLSDYSIPLACLVGLLLYASSIGFTFLIPMNPSRGKMPGWQAIGEFIGDIRYFLSHIDGRFSVLGSAFFWTVSNILRLGMFVWVPLALGLTGNKPVSLLMAVIGIGIGIGALLAPRLICLRTYRRAILFGVLMSAVVMALSFVQTLPLAVGLIFLVGVLSGIYIVPVNTLNEYLGDCTIGTGRATTVQNFAENTFMLLGTGAYSLAEYVDIPIDHTIRGAGILLLVFMLFLAGYRKGEPIAVRGDAERC